MAHHDIAAAILKQLTRLSVGSCTCGAKSPDIQWHDGGCRYRLVEEIRENVEAIAEPRLPFSHDQRAQAAVLADLPDSVAQEAGSFYETYGSLHKDCLKRDCMAEAWAHVLRPYLIGLRDHYPPQARPSDASQADSNTMSGE